MTTRSPLWDPQPRLVTARQAAELLSIGRSSVYQLMRTGQLPSLKIGRSRRIPLQEVAAFVSRSSKAAQS